MKFEIQTISLRKFLLIGILGAPIIVFLSVGLSVLFSNGYYVYLGVALFGLNIFLAQKFSKSITKIDLGESDYITINEQVILYRNIVGYYVNKEGLTQTAFCLRLDTEKTIQIVGSSVGEVGEKFSAVQNEIVSKLKSKNLDLQELEYADVYVRQTNTLRPIIYFSIGAVIILNILAIYLMVSGKMNLPWQLFFANGLIFILIPYLKKGKLNKR